MLNRRLAFPWTMLSNRLRSRARVLRLLLVLSTLPSVVTCSVFVGPSVPPPQPELVADGAGGVFVVWEEQTDHHVSNQGTTWHPYVRRVDASGAARWERPVGNQPAKPYGPHRAVSDGAGGVIVVWMDSRSNRKDEHGWGEADLYAGRIDAEGRDVWQETGVPIQVGPGHHVLKGITSDGAGGVIVVWLENQAYQYSLNAQRLDGEGVPLWSAGGVFIGTGEAAPRPDNVSLKADDSGGAVIAWEIDSGHGAATVVAQRLDPNGQTTWRENGLRLGGSASGQAFPLLVPSGTGRALVIWREHSASDEPPFGEQVTVQMISQDGVPLWDERNQILPKASPGSLLTSVRAVSDLQGGAFVAWSELVGGSPNLVDGGHSIHIQRVDVNGERPWPTFQVFPAAGSAVAVVSDCANGAILVFEAGGDTLAQRIDGDGITRWRGQGTIVFAATARSAHTRLAAASDEIGGIIVAHGPRRLQRLDSGGKKLWP